MTKLEKLRLPVSWLTSTVPAGSEPGLVNAASSATTLNCCEKTPLSAVPNRIRDEVVALTGICRRRTMEYVAAVTEMKGVIDDTVTWCWVTNVIDRLEPTSGPELSTT